MLQVKPARISITKAVLWSSAYACMTLATISSHALESMNDEALSQKTGKDGLTIKIKHSGGIGVDAIRLIDGDGIADDANRNFNGLNHAAGISLNNTTNKVRFCTDNTTTCTTSNQVTTIVVDTDAGTGTGGAFINTNISTNAKAIIIPLNTISLVGGQGFSATTGHSTWSKNVNIVEFSNGVTIDFNDSAISANVQLGAQPQGHMMLLSGVDGLSINLGEVKLLSYNVVDASGATANSQITTNVNIDNIHYGGVYADIDGTDGLVMGMPNEITIGTVSVNDTVFGKVGTVASDGLSTAPMGNINIDTIKINNLKIGITGM